MTIYTDLPYANINGKMHVKSNTIQGIYVFFIKKL